ncbi:hypothetical protein EZS27_015212 [termite gut metagenome]|uniref:Uncharacterized protein n=1 Tax=termite gut metagenome TaxID=433724 RepID=A0A5J4RTM2_9ZZZZ
MYGIYATVPYDTFMRYMAKNSACQFYPATCFWKVRIVNYQTAIAWQVSITSLFRLFYQL